MIPRADTVGTRPVSSLEAAKPTILTGDARQEVFQRLNRIALGTHFRAEVLSHLKDGSFLVKVAGGAVKMNLPDGAQVGDTVDLTLAATQPRLTFLLAAPRQDNTTSLSTTGRFIDSILHAAQEDGGTPTAVVGKTPLASSPDVKPDQLASAMKNALTFSGLFYESHVAQWASGERPLKILMAEPQARHSDPKLLAAFRPDAGDTPADAEKAEPATAQLARLAENLQGKPEAAPVLMELLRAAVRSLGNPLAGQTAAAQDADGAPPAASTAALAHDPAAANSATTATSPATAQTETMNAESARMISLQLNTLEQQRVAWQGELWPGQPIEWEISEDTPHGPDTSAEQRVWHSTVRFELPALGSIAASVRLTGERLQIQVRAADETAAALLRMHSGMLSSALAAAGSPLELLSVKQDESA